MAVIAGTSGAVKIATVPIGYLTKCELDASQDTDTQGPYIGDPTTTTTRTGKSVKVSCEGVMVKPTNAGQQDIIDAYNAGTDVAMVVELGSPAEQTFTCSSTVISGLKIGLDTGSGAPFSFEAQTNGTFSIVAAI